MQDLKGCIKQYKNVDDELRALNKQVYDLREKRKMLEIEIGDILRDPKFEAYSKLKIEEDGSTIKIQRPNTWSKAWTLSKKDLTEHLQAYFALGGSKNADACYEFILERQKEKLVSEEFSLTRIVASENVEQE
jgi:hypothetical protein